MRFIVCSDLMDCVLVSVETLTATERRELRMRGGAHRFVSFPLPMTGPVGCPVGESPGGSSETAYSGVAPGPVGKSSGDSNLGGAVRRQNTERQRFAAGRDQPQLGDARRVGPVGHRHHRDHRAFDVDDGNKNALAVSFNGSESDGTSVTSRAKDSR